MLNIKDLYVDVDLVLSKKAQLGLILSPKEISDLEKTAEKNHWDDNTTIANIYRYIRENISDLLDNSDFMDANITIEPDFHNALAMKLMEATQRHCNVLLVDKENKYPGSWINTIATALKGLECESHQYMVLVWEAYFMRHYNTNKDIPGWAHLADVLDDYFNSL